MLRHIEGHLGTLWHNLALQRRVKPLSEIFGTLRNPWIYIRASKACRTCEDHEYSELWDSQNSFIKHFQGYLDIFRDIDAYSATFTCAQLGRKGEASPVIF